MTPTFFTCDLCDDHKNELPEQFRVLPSVFRDFGGVRKFCGPVGIRALTSMPMPTEKRHAGVTGVPVQMQGVCGRPGDWLYADKDGMVVSARQLG